MPYYIQKKNAKKLNNHSLFVSHALIDGKGSYLALNKLLRKFVVFF